MNAPGGASGAGGVSATGGAGGSSSGGVAGSGSGVCVRHSGDILTSAATVGTATSAEIATTTGEKWSAKVVGRDTASGLVLLDAQRPVRAVILQQPLQFSRTACHG